MRLVHVLQIVADRRHAAADADVLAAGGAPCPLQRGERALFAGLDLFALGDQVAETVNGERATHVFIRR